MHSISIYNSSRLMFENEKYRLSDVGRKVVRSYAVTIWLSSNKRLYMKRKTLES